MRQIGIEIRKSNKKSKYNYNTQIKPMSRASTEQNAVSIQFSPSQLNQKDQSMQPGIIGQIENQQRSGKEHEELNPNLPTIINKTNQRGTEQLINEFASLPQPFQSKSAIYYKPQPIKLESPNKENSSLSKREPMQNINSRDWQQYSKQIYRYYCKSTYQTGRTPTFDHIQSSTNRMTVSTFVSFCRSFDIKLDLIMLMNIFKKATSFASSMSYDQFVEALFIISETIFKNQNCVADENEFMEMKQINTPNKKENLKEDHKKQTVKRQPPEQFEKFLKMIKMDSLSAFNNKKVELDLKSRKHGVNAHENLIKLKPASEYKFQVSALNGKNSQEMKQQLQLRKKMKSMSKQQTKEMRQLKEKLEAHRYAQLNKIAISDKKIMKGGYITPPLRNNNEDIRTLISSGDSNILNKSLLESHLRPLKNLRTFGHIQTEGLKQDRSKRTNQRHKTQFNTYSNSLETSMYDLLEKRAGNDEQKDVFASYEGKLSRLSRKTKGYLQQFREKDNKSRNGSQSREKKKYQINRIIKQAKEEVEEDDTQTTKVKVTNSNNTSNHMTEKKISIKLKTSPDEKQVRNLGLQDVIRDFKDDEYLEKLSRFQKKEGLNQKKQVIREYINF